MRTVILSFVMALVGAAVYLMLLHVAPDRILASSLGDENKIRDEDFMCVDHPMDVVIVGSSLSAALHPLPTRWENLAQVGGSALTGLELVLRSRNKPRVVVVETNVFGYASRGLKEDLVDEVAFPGVVGWRCHHRILQHKYRPVDVLVSVAASFRRSSQGRASSDESSAEAGAPEPDLETLVQRQDRLDGIRIQMETQSTPPPPQVLEAQARTARDVCEKLAAAGTNCLLMELPVDPVVAVSPFASAVRARMRDLLPEPRFSWMPTIAPSSVRTSDGIHLTPSSAHRVLAQMGTWVASHQ
jgi:hypothetical protein